jgi:putative tricarboxylic transport membrane protein
VKRIHLLASLVCVGLGVFFVYQGYRLRLEGQLGPGPGFFPFLIGIGLSALGVVWFTQLSLQPAAAAPAASDALPSNRIIVLTVIAALVAFMLLLRPLGFNLAMLSLLLLLFFVMDRQYPLAKAVIAVLGSFGVHYVFEQLLRVPLPYASLPFLVQLGL